ncbi:response regulator transcription factor [Nesterenkonia sp. HG001]|uniref:response regulator transcription factor n=1 Tax=Nesterenkonia sp. HG001 TaxID=2983207 RepID=UPI002AC5F402|nr:response regulator transcription factor [Nesterenkonia sp. HG001]MDZ5079043.1 response regulator transcription factor [Nesterenkonia sp. HG001]
MMGAAEPTRPLRVVLVDDHASIRAGLRLLLDTADDIEVIGEAADGAAAVRQVQALRPDVVIMDARMPGTDGISATRQIVGAGACEVLMLTTFDLDEVVFGALRAGAAGFLLKSAEPRELLEAIRRVGAGDGVVAPEVTRKLLRAFADTGDDSRGDPRGDAGAGGHGPTGPSAGPGRATLPALGSQPLAEVLTPREIDVLGALGRGLSNAQIAEELVISLATVKTHVSSVLAKLHLNSRMQAAILAREAGLAQ